MDLKFKGKQRKQGNSMVVTIPKPISDLLNADDTYSFKIEELKKR